jgi:hypothetical protein
MQSINTPAGPIKAGDMVTYTTFSGEPRTCTITTVTEDVKNGRPGFEADADACWGYADQVTSVRKA